MSSSVFGRVLLITGNAEFLASRARARAVAQVRAESPECEVVEAVGGSLTPGELAGLTGPSLFSDASLLVLTELENLADGPAGELLAHAQAPAPEVAVICVHGGGQKGKGLLDKLRKAPSVSEVKVAAPKYERDYVGWVRQEARELFGRNLDEEAATVLVQAVGQDLRALAGAVDQLASDSATTGALDTATVRRYFGGRAEVRGYEIADAAVEGRLSVALERARWAETAKVAPVLITAAFASALRSLAAVASAPAGLSDADLARQAGVPPFKLRSLRQQLRTWAPSGLRRAIEAVARADVDVKGGADPGYAVERMVIAVTAARGR